MRCWQAIKALEEGKKVRRKEWGQEAYIEWRNQDISNVITDEEGQPYELGILYCTDDNEWELYDDRKDCPKVFKDLWKVFQATQNDNIVAVEKFWADVPFSFITLHQEMERLLNEMNQDYKLDDWR